MNEFFEKVCNQFDKHITDEIFLFIQNDRELMSEYLHLVASNGNLDTVNSNLAKHISKHYGIVNSNETEENPQSTLIQTHAKFEKK